MGRFAFAMILGLLSGPVYAQDPLTDAINATRRAYGLRDLVYDAGLAGWAATNNQHQQSRGMGHYVMGPASRQNAAWGSNTVEGVMWQWVNSPGHLAGFLDTGIMYSGGSFDGHFWTWDGAVTPTVALMQPQVPSPPEPPPGAAPPAVAPPAPIKTPPPAVVPTSQAAYPVAQHFDVGRGRRGFHPIRGIGRAFSKILCH
jgi:hypothetical protein